MSADHDGLHPEVGPKYDELDRGIEMPPGTDVVAPRGVVWSPDGDRL
ncbi:hypothetical protein [Actinoplanes cyaneus]|nr:hypothetical protein [Actinoplanes cyaneus]